jgi:hypothetical protein
MEAISESHHRPSSQHLGQPHISNGGNLTITGSRTNPATDNSIRS